MVTTFFNLPYNKKKLFEQSGLSYNPALTTAFIEKNKNKLQWNWVAMNANLSLQFIRDNQNTLEWNNIVRRTRLTIPFVREFKKRFDERDSNGRARWWGASGNKSLTTPIIKEFIREEWDWEQISRSAVLTPAFIEKYEHKLDWSSLSANKSFTIPLIKKYRDKVDWSQLLHNRSLTLEFVKKEYLEKTPSQMAHWKDREKYEKNIWSKISMLELSPAQIEQYQDDLDWKMIGGNSSLTLDLILKYENRIIWGGRIGSNLALTNELMEKYKRKGRAKGKEKWQKEAWKMKHLQWNLLASNPAIFNFDEGLLNHQYIVSNYKTQFERGG
jgi:hypothetical protein